ncbi:MAG: hypothetical protein ABIY70_18290 [Capsulimonas sp.]|uniref:hypothetical protein n=1 Tax=Capsulimonas sp. TaxID=2494211 RepID=UPI003266B831
MTGEQYRALLIRYRQQQLEATRDNIKRLETVYDRASKSIVGQLAATPEDSLRASYLGGLGESIDATLKALRSDFADLLVVSMTDSAQEAATREATVAELAGAAEDRRLIPSLTTNRKLTDGTVVKVAFGDVAQSAVERSASRVYSDGWQLSSRLTKLDASIRTTIQDTIVQGVAEQLSAKKLADRLQGAMTDAGADNPRYQAMRIARTEINTAHREAHILSCTDGNGQLKPYILAVGWRLSLSHPHADICDIYAADDGAGLGAGNFLPADVPSSHPHCLCYTITVLTDYPDIHPPNKAPDVEAVPASQLTYYADKYADQAAARRLLKLAEQETTALSQAPISTVFNVNATRGKQGIDHAIQTIETVHTVPDTLTAIPVLTDSQANIGALGQYSLDPAKRKIEVAYDGGWPAMTMAHETGHFLDHVALGDPSIPNVKGFGSNASQALDDWRQAVHNSKAYSDLQQIYASGVSLFTDQNGIQQRVPVSPAFFEYLLKPWELFARSYAQYIAVESKDPVLLAELTAARDTFDGKATRRQWQDADFEAIRQAFNDLFEVLGWRQKQGP